MCFPKALPSCKSWLLPRYPSHLIWFVKSPSQHLQKWSKVCDFWCFLPCHMMCAINVNLIFTLLPHNLLQHKAFVIGLFLYFWQHWLLLELFIDLCNFAHHIFKVYYNNIDVLSSNVKNATCLNVGALEWLDN